VKIMKITKMHGIGNDYVYVDGFEETVGDAPGLARRVSDRHFGVGGDGLILIQPPEPTGEEVDCRMEMYNADGSRAQMCGNGIRCVAKYVHDHGICRQPSIRIQTDAGLRTVTVEAGPDGKVALVTVDMGIPILAQRDVPGSITSNPEEPAVEVPLEVESIGTVTVTLVSTGNPHCVVRLGDHQPLPSTVDALPLAKIGPLFENHPAFPQRINTEFVVVRGPKEFDFRVWERGSGETLACGTGACATVVAGILGQWSDRQVVVHLRGGDLSIRVDESDGHVFMTGPATEVFTAELDDAWLAG
jgi:diaminopimelate epimerase